MPSVCPQLTTVQFFALVASQDIFAMLCSSYVIPLKQNIAEMSQDGSQDKKNQIQNPSSSCCYLFNYLLICAAFILLLSSFFIYSIIHLHRYLFSSRAQYLFTLQAHNNQVIEMGLEIKNLFQLPHIIKLPVLVSPIALIQKTVTKQNMKWIKNQFYFSFLPQIR